MKNGIFSKACNVCCETVIVIYKHLQQIALKYSGCKSDVTPNQSGESRLRYPEIAFSAMAACEHAKTISYQVKQEYLGFQYQIKVSIGNTLSMERPRWSWLVAPQCHWQAPSCHIRHSVDIFWVLLVSCCEIHRQSSKQPQRGHFGV